MYVHENIFRGLLKCPDCGQTLLIHTDNRNLDRDLLDKTDYQCTTYRKKGANFCIAHQISAGDIERAIKADLDRHAVKAMKDKEKFTMMSAHYEQEQDANEEKLPELIAFFKESADIQTPDMLKLPVPEAEYENVVLKPSEYQQDMVSSLADRAEAVRNRLVEPLRIIC